MLLSIAELDNFTSISLKGNTTVHDLGTKHESFDSIIDCKVLSMNQVHEELRAYHVNFQPCKMLDHSIIVVTIDIGSKNQHEEYTVQSENESEDVTYGQEKPVKFKINGV